MGGSGFRLASVRRRRLGSQVVDIFAYSLAEQGIWLAFGVSNVLAAGLAAAWFFRGTWREADPRTGSDPAVADD